MITRGRLEPGITVEAREILTIHSEHIRIPDRRRLVHLQFRRFAGCPVCDLHLHSIAQRHQEIVTASIQEVVVFHSSTDELLHYVDDLPFAVIADPNKRLYADFRVESAPRALLDPRTWVPVIRGILRSLDAILRGKQPVPSLNPQGGRLGLPADFLIASDGNLIACKYGSHAYDQWSVDELLRLSKSKFQAREVPDLTLGQSRTVVSVAERSNAKVASLKELKSRKI
jgi:hypothetical protein